VLTALARLRPALRQAMHSPRVCFPPFLPFVLPVCAGCAVRQARAADGALRADAIGPDAQPLLVMCVVFFRPVTFCVLRPCLTFCSDVVCPPFDRMMI
jgi:hypothetical protein